MLPVFAAHPCRVIVCACWYPNTCNQPPPPTPTHHEDPHIHIDKILSNRWTWTYTLDLYHPNEDSIIRQMPSQQGTDPVPTNWGLFYMVSSTVWVYWGPTIPGVSSVGCVSAVTWQFVMCRTPFGGDNKPVSCTFVYALFEIRFTYI